MDYKRIIVISDFHLTGGKDPVTGVWAVTEDFFWDDDFANFLNHYQDESPSLLIINGDLLDFLQVLVFPDDNEKKLYGINDRDINFTYGLSTSEGSCIFQLDKIFAGHPAFFKALALFISRGNYLKLLKGNHDIQFFWEKVQKKFINNLEKIAEENGKKISENSIEFLPWFFYIPQKLYVEHGNQYEYTTSFRNFLYPSLPYEYDEVGKQIELDLSSFLIRYFSNRMECINPLSDNIRPISKYFGEFWKNHPYIFITSVGTAFRYVLKAFQKARAMSYLKKKSTEIDSKNIELIKAEACKPYPDHNEEREKFEKNLFTINELKAEPILSSGPFRFLWNMIKTPLKGLLWLLPFYLLMILPDINNTLQKQISIDNSFLRSTVNVLFDLKIPTIIIFILLAVILISIRTWIRKRKIKHNKPEPDEIRIKIRESASKIAGLLKVKYIVFGHTHYADIKKLSDTSFYFNTGTWMGIFAPEEELYRNVRQFTYFVYENDEGGLYHWNINKNIPEKVIVVDTEIPLTTDEDSIIRIILSLFRRS